MAACQAAGIPFTRIEISGVRTRLGSWTWMDKARDAQRYYPTAVAFFVPDVPATRRGEARRILEEIAEQVTPGLGVHGYLDALRQLGARALRHLRPT